MNNAEHQVQQNNNHSILQSVIHITGQRDIESLEYSLVATIAEMLPVQEVKSYKLINPNDCDHVEEVVSFNRIDTTRDKQKDSYQWNESSQIINPPELVKSSIKSSNCTRQKRGQLQFICYPIFNEEKPLAALSLIIDRLNDDQNKMLEGLIKVYSNYLAILNESERDKLTGLLNRRTFDTKFERLLQTQQQRQQQIIEEQNKNDQRTRITNHHAHLAMVDIDFFKRINDNFGHIYGDEILLLLANLMRENFRTGDLLFRFGGEEFVILLEPGSKQQVNSALERFRHLVENYNFPQVGQVTLSIGYIEISDNCFSTDILGKADEALYFAKEHGRNCVHSYETLSNLGHIKTSDSSGSSELF